MATSTGPHRRRAQLLTCVGIGAVTTLIGTASPAFAADGVTVRLEPTEVMLAALPIENFGGDPDAWFGAMGGGMTSEATSYADFVPVPVQFNGTIAVDVPDGLDASAATAELVFDANGDGIPEATYSSLFAPADPKYLDITPTAGTVEVPLPADDPMVVDAATLSIGGLTSTLGPAFSDVYDTIDYEIEFDAATPPTAPPAQTVEPVLIAFSSVPCDLSTYERCPVPTPVFPGSTVTLDLTQASVLRELGLSDLSGVEVHLSALDEDGYDIDEGSPVAVEVTGSQASFVLPEDAEPGSYSLYVTQETPSGGASTVVAELTVEAAAAPVAAPEAAPAAPKTNAGLRSNTGVHLPEAGASDAADGAAVATGAGILLLAGVGAATAVARSRRPAAEGGTCEV
jgi:hypothetical protein